jgi:hypothetical protein
LALAHVNDSGGANFNVFAEGTRGIQPHLKDIDPADLEGVQ